MAIPTELEIARIQLGLEKYFKETYGPTLKAEFETMGISLKTGDLKLYLPVTITWDHVTKTGKVMKKKKTIKFYPPFDPLTGKPYEEDNFNSE